MSTDDAVDVNVYADTENVRVAVAIRAARAALGINQQELADALDIPKSTVARIETLEMQPKVDVYVRALRFFKNAGIELDPIYSEEIVMRITPKSLAAAKQFLDDESKRRADRKVRRSTPEK